MPKARRLGNFLKAADIGGRGGTAVVRIEEAGERNITDYRQDGALEIPVTPHTPPTWTTGGNDPKTWSLNRTSEDTLLNYIGEDSENWIGKTTRINVLQQNVRGQMRDVLYSEALTSEEQPKVATKLKPPYTAKGDTPIVSEETRRYLKYNETLIGEIVDAGSWNNMPKTVKKELAGLNWIVYQDGYPTLSPDASAALE